MLLRNNVFWDWLTSPVLLCSIRVLSTVPLTTLYHTPLAIVPHNGFPCKEWSGSKYVRLSLLGH